MEVSEFKKKVWQIQDLANSKISDPQEWLNKLYDALDSLAPRIAYEDLGSMIVLVALDETRGKILQAILMSDETGYTIARFAEIDSEFILPSFPTPCENGC